MLSDTIILIFRDESLIRITFLQNYQMKASRFPETMDAPTKVRPGALALSIFFIMMMFFTQYILAEASYSFLQHEITVYRDGVAHVRSIVEVNSTVPSISLPLPAEAANILATDENGRLLRYEQTRDSILVYTFGASKVVLEYDTASLTRKDGTVWTLKTDLPTHGRIVLPDGAIIVYLSEKPTSIEAKDGRPVLILAPGSWEISYVIPLQVTTAASTTTGPTSVPPAIPLLVFIATVVIIALIAVLGALLRRRSRFSSEALSHTDSEMLQLISSRGGRVFESELRDSLGLPKTSAWRRIKRLEKMGLVRTRKVGSQNEIELA